MPPEYNHRECQANEELKVKRDKSLRFEIKQRYHLTHDKKEEVADIKKSAEELLKSSEVNISNPQVPRGRNRFYRFYPSLTVNSDLVQVNSERQTLMEERGIDPEEYKGLYRQLTSKIIKPAGKGSWDSEEHVQLFVTESKELIDKVTNWNAWLDRSVEEIQSDLTEDFRKEADGIKALEKKARELNLLKTNQKAKKVGLESGILNNNREDLVSFADPDSVSPEEADINKLITGIYSALGRVDGNRAFDSSSNVNTNNGQQATDLRKLSKEVDFLHKTNKELCELINRIDVNNSKYSTNLEPKHFNNDIEYKDSYYNFKIISTRDLFNTLKLTYNPEDITHTPDNLTQKYDVSDKTYEDLEIVGGKLLLALKNFDKAGSGYLRDNQVKDADLPGSLKDRGIDPKELYEFVKQSRADQDMISTSLSLFGKSKIEEEPSTVIDKANKAMNKLSKYIKLLDMDKQEAQDHIKSGYKKQEHILQHIKSRVEKFKKAYASASDQQSSIEQSLSHLKDRSGIDMNHLEEKIREAKSVLPDQNESEAQVDFVNLSKNTDILREMNKKMSRTLKDLDTIKEQVDYVRELVHRAQREVEIATSALSTIQGQLITDRPIMSEPETLTPGLEIDSQIKTESSSQPPQDTLPPSYHTEDKLSEKMQGIQSMKDDLYLKKIINETQQGIKEAKEWLDQGNWRLKEPHSSESADNVSSSSATPTEIESNKDWEALKTLSRISKHAGKTREQLLSALEGQLTSVLSNTKTSYKDFQEFKALSKSEPPHVEDILLERTDLFWKKYITQREKLLSVPLYTIYKDLKGVETEDREEYQVMRELLITNIEKAVDCTKESRRETAPCAELAEVLSKIEETNQILSDSHKQWDSNDKRKKQIRKDSAKDNERKRIAKYSQLEHIRSETKDLKQEVTLLLGKVEDFRQTTHWWPREMSREEFNQTLQDVASHLSWVDENLNKYVDQAKKMSDDDRREDIFLYKGPLARYLVDLKEDSKVLSEIIPKKEELQSELGDLLSSVYPVFRVINACQRSAIAKQKILEKMGKTEEELGGLVKDIRSTLYGASDNVIKNDANQDHLAKTVGALRRAYEVGLEIKEKILGDPETFRSAVTEKLGSLKPLADKLQYFERPGDERQTILDQVRITKEQFRNRLKFLENCNEWLAEDMSNMDHDQLAHVLVEVDESSIILHKIETLYNNPDYEILRESDSNRCKNKLEELKELVKVTKTIAKGLDGIGHADVYHKKILGEAGIKSEELNEKLKYINNLDIEEYVEDIEAKRVRSVDLEDTIDKLREDEKTLLEVKELYRNDLEENGQQMQGLGVIAHDLKGFFNSKFVNYEEVLKKAETTQDKLNEAINYFDNLRFVNVNPVENVSPADLEDTIAQFTENREILLKVADFYNLSVENNLDQLEEIREKADKINQFIDDIVDFNEEDVDHKKVLEKANTTQDKLNEIIDYFGKFRSKNVKLADLENTMAQLKEYDEIVRKLRESTKEGLKNTQQQRTKLEKTVKGIKEDIKYLSDFFENEYANHEKVLEEAKITKEKLNEEIEYFNNFHVVNVNRAVENVNPADLEDTIAQLTEHQKILFKVAYFYNLSVENNLNRLDEIKTYANSIKPHINDIINFEEKDVYHKKVLKKANTTQDKLKEISEYFDNLSVKDIHPANPENTNTNAKLKEYNEIVRKFRESTQEGLEDTQQQRTKLRKLWDQAKPVFEETQKPEEKIKKQKLDILRELKMNERNFDEFFRLKYQYERDVEKRMKFYKMEEKQKDILNATIKKNGEAITRQEYKEIMNLSSNMQKQRLNEWGIKNEIFEKIKENIQEYENEYLTLQKTKLSEKAARNLEEFKVSQKLTEEQYKAVETFLKDKNRYIKDKESIRNELGISKEQFSRAIKYFEKDNFVAASDLENAISESEKAYKILERVAKLHREDQKKRLELNKLVEDARPAFDKLNKYRTSEVVEDKTFLENLNKRLREDSDNGEAKNITQERFNKFNKFFDENVSRDKLANTITRLKDVADILFVAEEVYKKILEKKGQELKKTIIETTERYKEVQDVLAGTRISLSFKVTLPDR